MTEEDRRQRNRPRADPELRKRVDAVLEQIRMAARTYTTLTEDEKKLAKGELHARVEAAWKRLAEPPHKVGCACKECLADEFVRA